MWVLGSRGDGGAGGVPGGKKRVARTENRETTVLGKIRGDGSKRRQGAEARGGVGGGRLEAGNLTGRWGKSMQKGLYCIISWDWSAKVTLGGSTETQATTM